MPETIDPTNLGHTHRVRLAAHLRQLDHPELVHLAIDLADALGGTGPARVALLRVGKPRAADRIDPPPPPSTFTPRRRHVAACCMTGHTHDDRAHVLNLAHVAARQAGEQLYTEHGGTYCQGIAPQYELIRRGADGAELVLTVLADGRTAIGHPREIPVEGDWIVAADGRLEIFDADQFAAVYELAEASEPPFGEPTPAELDDLAPTDPPPADGRPTPTEVATEAQRLAEIDEFGV